MSNKVTIRRLKSGVPGLDNLLGGGVPEYSFNLLVGNPGSGKTTMAHQMMFSQSNSDCRALFFTVLGEDPIKILRYQQQFTFFDFEKVNHCVKFINLADDLMDSDFDRVLGRISTEVENFSPNLVFVDSFRSIIQSTTTGNLSAAILQPFIHRFSMQMSSWQATTFLIAECVSPEAELNPLFTVADGIIWMSQSIHRDAIIRKIQVMKLRGQPQSPGAYTFRINNHGVEIFPRGMIKTITTEDCGISGNRRLSTGVAALDEMLGGGLPVGYSMLVVGPTGSGKTVLATQFLAEGVRVGEPGIIVACEKNPHQLLSFQLTGLIKSGGVGVIDTLTLNWSLDEILYDLVEMIKKMKAKRVVIDSLSGFELALVPVFREGFREALYRMVSVLTGMGMTVLMTAELEDHYTSLRFSSYGNAFMVDAIVMQRYVELASQLKRVISVVKVRASPHSKAIRLYEIAEDNMIIGDELSNYKGILSDCPMIAS